MRESGTGSGRPRRPSPTTGSWSRLRFHSAQMPTFRRMSSLRARSVPEPVVNGGQRRSAPGARRALRTGIGADQGHVRPGSPRMTPQRLHPQHLADPPGPRAMARKGRHSGGSAATADRRVLSSCWSPLRDVRHSEGPTGAVSLSDATHRAGIKPPDRVEPAHPVPGRNPTPCRTAVSPMPRSRQSARRPVRGIPEVPGRGSRGVPGGRRAPLRGRSRPPSRGAVGAWPPSRAGG